MSKLFCKHLILFFQINMHNTINVKECQSEYYFNHINYLSKKFSLNHQFHSRSINSRALTHELLSISHILIQLATNFG